MVVNETTLEVAIIKMRKIVRAKRDEFSDARNTLESLDSIAMVKDPDDETKKIKPDDPKTKSLISAARRLELYNDSIPKVDAYPNP